MSIPSAVLINGQPGNAIDPRDRGLAYGHGVFETVLLIHGKPAVWDAHMARLSEGATRLSIPLSSEISTTLLQDIATLVDLLPSPIPARAVLKIIVTRGAGGRGYAVIGEIPVTRIVSISPYPEYPGDPVAKGISTMLCETRLARSAQLAGIKHLNRLEQVMARAEWTDPTIREGLVCDSEGYLIEGTMSNLCWISGDTLYTPALTYSGVNGIIRQQILAYSEDLGLSIQVGDYTVADLQRADEVLVCNSIIGVWPVTECRINNNLTYHWPAGAMTSRIRHCLTEQGII